MKENTLTTFYLNIILRVDRMCLLNKTYIFVYAYTYIYGMYHSKGFSLGTQEFIL